MSALGIFEPKMKRLWTDVNGFVALDDVRNFEYVPANVPFRVWLDFNLELHPEKFYKSERRITLANLEPTFRFEFFGIVDVEVASLEWVADAVYAF